MDNMHACELGMAVTGPACCFLFAHPAVALALKVCANIHECCVQVLHGIIVGTLYSLLKSLCDLQAAGQVEMSSCFCCLQLAP